jgi:hypothetical protein
LPPPFQVHCLISALLAVDADTTSSTRPLLRLVTRWAGAEPGRSATGRIVPWRQPGHVIWLRPDQEFRSELVAVQMPPLVYLSIQMRQEPSLMRNTAGPS